MNRIYNNMENNKLKELTEKIYSEGLEKGRQEGEAILQKAKEQSEKMIAEAKAQVESMLAEANKEVTVIKKNVENDLRMSVKQTLNTLKQSVTNMITTELIDIPVETTLKDKEFVNRLIGITLEKWNFEKNDGVQVSVPVDNKEELERYIKTTLTNLFNKGVDVQGDKRIKTGFRIGPKDNKYIISFTEQDFENYFKQFAGPRIQNLLFDTKE